MPGSKWIGLIFKPENMDINVKDENIHVGDSIGNRLEKLNFYP